MAAISNIPETVAERLLMVWVRPAATAFVALLSFTLNFDSARLLPNYPIIYAIESMLSGGKALWTLAICVGILIISGAIQLLRHETITSYKKKLESSERQLNAVGDHAEMMLEGLLLNLAKRLGFSPDGQSRATIYLHVPALNLFSFCGRYSENPELRKKGRSTFPDDKGCISKGWRNGWHLDRSIPDDDADAAQYHRDTYGVAKGTYQTLKMKSKLFAVQRIKDGSRPVAVIVVESVERSAFDDHELRAALDAASEDFGAAIGALRHYIWSPKKADSIEDL